MRRSNHAIHIYSPHVRCLAAFDRVVTSGRPELVLATGGFYIQASGGSVALPTAGYHYTATELLRWRDFHPQEWQLASLHQNLVIDGIIDMAR